MYKKQPAAGDEFVLEKIVEHSDTATAYGSGGVDVFATPAMISLMENTCLRLVAPCLEEGWTTVGTEVSVKHIKATPVGMKVTCRARLVEVNGPKLKFEVEAFDEQGKIGFGTHKRYVVNLSKFLKNVYNQ